MSTRARRHFNIFASPESKRALLQQRETAIGAVKDLSNEMNASFFIRKTAVNALVSLANVVPDPVLLPNKAFRNKHQGERCFILGSGLSVKEYDLKKLAGEVVMTQNHFNVHPDIATIKPTYHVVVPKFHPTEYDQDWIDWINQMHDTLPADTHFFFGKNTRGIIESATPLAARSSYIATGYHAIRLRKAKADITKRVMTVPTVITQCLIIALYMGFKEIYLLGFDMDQICRMRDRDNIRFYGQSKITANAAENKIMDDLTSGGAIFFNFWQIWRQLTLLRDKAEADGQVILNASAHGILDVYPRVDYDGLFK